MLFALLCFVFNFDLFGLVWLAMQSTKRRVALRCRFNLFAKRSKRKNLTKPTSWRAKIVLVSVQMDVVSVVAVFVDDGGAGGFGSGSSEHNGSVAQRYLEFV